MDARSLRRDRAERTLRAWLELGRYVATERNTHSVVASGAKVGESEGRALASHQLIEKGMDHEVFKRADFEAFFKALKESGNTLENTLGYSYAAHTLPSTTDKLLDIFKSAYTATSEPSITRVEYDEEAVHGVVILVTRKRSPIPFAKASDRCKGRGGACDRLEKSWIKQKELYAQGRSSLDGLN
ncbi:hypothetical protein DY000_02060091 [Brassica cretica]|uniref:Uncharacterized protein n=1 Tax=Brassica cretica TaxID=69181 RepID=A0ABQ7AS52_BRACR|nr:hypothetical protein DY000_02060091 [Brassica cretica]